MAIYLGSEKVKIFSSEYEIVPTSTIRSIIDRTIENYYNSRVGKIGSYAFYNCSNLTSVSFLNCSYIEGYAFYSCNLATISFPNCSYIGSYAFRYCSNLVSVSFPNCNYIGSYAFGNCYSLISLDLIGVSSVPSLANINAFSSTPIGGYSTSAGQYGSVYVPASLYNSFLTATNWSSISSRIVSA